MLGVWAALFGLQPAYAEDDDADAEAKEPAVSLSFTDDLEIRLQNFDPSPLVRVGGPPPKFIEEVNRFTGRAQAGAWGFNVQVDQVAFIGLPYAVDGVVVREPPDLLLNCGLESCVQNPFGDYVYVNPEKMAVSYATDDVSVTVGDLYAAFGYGLALNVNRNVDIDIDTSIQGARVVARPGDWEFTGLAGTLNRQQVFADNPNFATLQGDLRHLVAGARAVRHDIGPASVGAHAVAVDFTQTYGVAGALEEAGSSVDAAMAGGTVELYGVAGMDWQFEGDIAAFPLDEQGRNILFTDGVPEMGHSLYGSTQFLIGQTFWQIDGKKYKNFQRMNRPLAGEQYQIIVPPTLEYERATNFNTAAAVLSDDIYGGRVRMDVALGSLTPYLSAAAFRDSDLENAAQHAPTPETIVMGQAGLQVLTDELTVLTNVLGRVEKRDEDFGQDVQIYGDVDVKFPLIGQSHADVIVFGQHFIAGPEATVFGDDVVPSWDELSLSATVAPTHDFGITGYFDYTTNPFANNGGNLGNPNLYGAVEAYFKPTSAWTLRAFHGGYAAGIRCSGGQCRAVPAFTGTRLAITGSF